MIIDSAMTKKSYIKLIIALMFKRAAVWVFLSLSFICLIFGFILLVLIHNYSILVLWLILEISFVVYYWFVINRYTNSKENSKLFLPRRFEFNDDVILIKTSFSKEEFNWDTIVKWRFLARQYVLYVTSHTFFQLKVKM